MEGRSSDHAAAGQQSVHLHINKAQSPVRTFLITNLHLSVLFVVCVLVNWKVKVSSWGMIQFITKIWAVDPRVDAGTATGRVQ